MAAAVARGMATGVASAARGMGRSAREIVLSATRARGGQQSATLAARNARRPRSPGRRRAA